MFATLPHQGRQRPTADAARFSPLARRGAGRGFTIVELMVALAISSILLGAVYSLFVSSTAVFHTQEQLGVAQYKARTALEQVLSDVRRAGFGATANAAADPMSCTNGGFTLHGMVVEEFSGEGIIPCYDSTNPNIDPDQITLTGNFSTARPYPGLANSISGQVGLQVSESEGNNAYVAGSLVFPRADFERVFLQLQRRLVAVRDANGRSYITHVSSGNYPELTLASLGGTGPACGIQGASSLVQVSPVDVVRYRIVRRALEDDGRGGDTLLVREALDTSGNPVENGRLIVAEDVVDLQVWFVFRDPTSNTLPPDPDETDTDSNLAISVNGEANARPELIRSAIVRVSVRTEMEHAGVAHRPRLDGDERLTSFDTDCRTGNGETGTAAVVSLTGQVEVPNFSLQNLQ